MSGFPLDDAILPSSARLADAAAVAPRRGFGRGPFPFGDVNLCALELGVERPELVERRLAEHTQMPLLVTARGHRLLLLGARRQRGHGVAFLVVTHNGNLAAMMRRQLEMRGGLVYEGGP